MDLNPECKLFIGGLNKQTDLNTLQKHFQQWGELVDSVVIADSKTKLSRGFGFVTYSKLEEVDECLAAGPHTIDSRKVDVKRAVPKEHSHVEGEPPRSKKVFMGGLPLTITEQEIEEVMVEFGEIDEVVIIKEKQSTTPRGFGFVIFKDFESAANACRKKHIKFKNYRDRDIEVKAALSVDEMKRSGGRDRDRRMPPFDHRDDRGYSRGGGRHDDYYGGGHPPHRDDHYDSLSRPYFSEPGYHGVGGGNPGGYGDRDPLYPSPYSSERSGYGPKPYAPVLDRVGGYNGGPGEFGSSYVSGDRARNYEPREYESGVYGAGSGGGVYGPGSGGFGSGSGAGGYGTGTISGGYGSGLGSGVGSGSGGYGTGAGTGDYGSGAGVYSSGSGGYGSYPGDFGGSSIGPIKSHNHASLGGGGGADGRSGGPYGGMGVHPGTGGYGGVRNPAGGSHGFHPYRR